MTRFQWMEVVGILMSVSGVWLSVGKGQLMRSCLAFSGGTARAENANFASLSLSWLPG
jgi:hypothetical protein